MPRAVDWKIAERRAIKRDPALRAETEKGILELLATGDEEDRRVAYHLARGLLELEFETDAELLAMLPEPVPA